MRKIFLLVLFAFSWSAHSAIIDVQTMSITGGSVSLNGSTPYELLPGDIQPMEMGQYQGSPACCSPDAALTSLAYYSFGSFGWAGIHTSEFDSLSHQASAPSAYVDTSDGSFHADLSALTWSFNGNNYHQGASDIVGVYDAVTGVYDISWSTLIQGGLFAGQTHDWQITGVATLAAVPLPGAVWLFGSGFIALTGFINRKKYA